MVCNREMIILFPFTLLEGCSYYDDDEKAGECPLAIISYHCPGEAKQGKGREGKDITILMAWRGMAWHACMHA